MNSTAYDSRVDFSSRQDFRDDLTFYDEQSSILEEEYPSHDTLSKKIQKDDAICKTMAEEANHIKNRLTAFKCELIETSREMLQEVENSTLELKELNDDTKSKTAEVSSLEKSIGNISDELEYEKRKTTMMHMLQAEYNEMGELFKAKSDALNRLKVKESTCDSNLPQSQILQALQMSVRLT